MLKLYLQAPFGVFRTFTAGSFRPTAGFITPSAAYGLLLNVAGIEMRHDDGKEMTLITEGLPPLSLALGALRLPLQQTMYQQLHNYPVGSTGREHAAATKGTKYNIAPARRSFLAEIRGYLCMEGSDQLEDWVLEGLAGKRPREYGLPFLGDNNFLIDKLEPVEDLDPAFWFVPLHPAEEAGVKRQVTRLTVTIDRQDMSNTRSALFVTTPEPQREIPKLAWVPVEY